MGRGAYDVTDPTQKKSAMAGTAIAWEDDNRRDREKAAAEVAAAAADEKLIRNKKSRGIMAAKKAEKASNTKPSGH